MQHRYVALLLVACTFAPLCPLRTFAQDLPSVVLSEIQWGGSSLSTADEWIELGNTSDASIDISGWTLTGIGSSGATLTIPEASILPARATYLIANYSMGDAKSTLPVSPQFVTSTVSIPNSSLAISLFDTGGTLIDAYSDSGTPDFGDTATSATIERNLLTGDWATSVPGGTPGTALFPEALLEEISTTEDFVDESSSEEQLLSEASPFSSDSETLSSPPEEEEQTETGGDSVQELSSSEVLSNDVSEIVSEDVEIITLISPVSTSTIVEALSETEEDPIVETPAPVVITETFDYSLLRLNEFVSDPTDGKEWVELYNAGNVVLDLSSVTVTDASGKQTVLSGSLSGDSYFVVENPVGKLNNDGDTISLLLADGQTLATLVYGTDSFSAPQKGFAAGACGDGWRTTLSPTPGAENTCPTTSLNSSSYATETATTVSLDLDGSDSGDSSTPQGDLSSSEGGSSESTSLTSVTTSVIDASVTDAEDSATLTNESAPQSMNNDASLPSSLKKNTSKNTIIEAEVSELDTLPSGQRVHVSGILVAAPGVFGKRIAYLNGVQLYFHKADWPELAAGTAIEVLGVWDVDTDSRRIKISAATDIVVLGTAQVTPVALADPSTFPSLGDVLVTAVGTFTQKEGELYVFAALDGSEFRVHDSGNTGGLTTLRAGDVVTVVGMLFAEDGMWTIVPRAADDISVSQPSSITPDTTVAASSGTHSLSREEHDAATPLIGGGILASTLSALGYWFVRSRKFSFIFSH